MTTCRFSMIIIEYRTIASCTCAREQMMVTLISRSLAHHYDV